MVYLAVSACFLATSLSLAVVILVLFQGQSRIEAIEMNSRMTIFLFVCLFLLIWININKMYFLYIYRSLLWHSRYNLEHQDFLGQFNEIFQFA